MNIKKLVAPFAVIVVFTWGARFIWKTEIWDSIEKIAISLPMLFVSIRIVQDSRKSNGSKKPCSKGIEQLSFIFKPDVNSATPYKKIEYFGYVLGFICLAMFAKEIITLLG